MPPRTPIEFVRQILGGGVQSAGNRVQLEDPTGVPYDIGNPLPIGGGAVGLTDAELRAAPVPVTTGGLTDAQLRVTPVPTSDAGPAGTPLFLYTLIAAGAITHVTNAPTAGEHIVVTDIVVSSDTPLSVLFEDHTGTDLMTIYLPANGTAQFTPRGKLKLAVADDVLTADPSGAGNVAILVFYYSEP